MKFILILFLGNIVSAQNILIPASFEASNKELKVTGMNILRNFEKSKFSSSWSDKLFIGEPHTVLDDSGSICISDMNSMRISWSLKEDLELNQPYRVSLDYYTTSTEMDFLKRMRFIKSIKSPQSKRDYEVTCAYPLFPYHSEIKSKQWNTVEFTFVGSSVNNNQLLLVLDRVDDEFAEDHLFIKNLSIERARNELDDNLIPNGDFELFHMLPDKVYFGDYYLLNWNKFVDFECIDQRGRSGLTDITINIDNNGVSHSPVVLGTPDHNTCMSNWGSSSKASSGIGYGRFRCDQIGLNKYTSIGEYLQIELSEKLIKGEKYLVAFKIKHDPDSRVISNGIGFRLSSCILNPFDELRNDEKLLPEATIMVSDKVIPRSEEWIQYTFEIIADGGEKYFTIGQFNNSAGNEHESLPSRGENMCFYLVDEVSLVKLIE